jgi:F-type H+-transporting ATPase subunit delta
MKINKQARREGRGLFRACMGPDGLDEGRVRQALARVIEGKPRGYLPILTHFARLIRLEVARRSANVQSATALAAPLRAQIEGDLTRHYGPGLAFAFSENPELIGGMRVQVGGDVYDGSVQGRLAALQQSA